MSYEGLWAIRMAICLAITFVSLWFSAWGMVLLFGLISLFQLAAGPGRGWRYVGKIFAASPKRERTPKEPAP